MGDGWAPSMVMDHGIVKTGIEALGDLENSKDGMLLVLAAPARDRVKVGSVCVDRGGKDLPGPLP